MSKKKLRKVHINDVEYVYVIRKGWDGTCVNVWLSGDKSKVLYELIPIREPRDIKEIKIENLNETQKVELVKSIDREVEIFRQIKKELIPNIE
jgi:hypothetical protein